MHAHDTEKEAWRLAQALQQSLGEETLDEATLRLAQHLLQAGLHLEQTLLARQALPPSPEGLRLLLLDVLLAWDDVGIAHTSLWNLFDALGAARGTRPLAPPAPDEDAFRAFRRALGRVRRHAGRPTMPAALVYAWAALARCLEGGLLRLARGLGRGERRPTALGLR